jgi:OmcA/MtrC family decaheme c-type cytochrome
VFRLRWPQLLLASALILLLGGIGFVYAGKTPDKLRRVSALSEAQANFVRPGLVIKILSAEIAADGTIRTRFKLTDPRGQPLDRSGVETPGPVSVSFIAAYIPRGQDKYVSYTVRTQTSPITGVAAIQAAGQNNGTFTKVGDGEFTYQFSIRANNVDRTVTHSIGAYGSRNMSELQLPNNYDDDVFNFVPNGSPVTVTRDVIRTESCNDCHHEMAFHGGSRRTMELCVLCHTPQTTDPDTGNTVDMAPMTHRIHAGASLPSVRAGKPYIIIGNQQSVHDYSKINFPADVRNCQVCHEQNRGAKQADAMFNASRAACGSCHDDVNFATGVGHINLPQISDNQCNNCHVRDGELDFDASILGAHRVPRFAKALPGVELKILEVTGAGPGKSPTIAFSIKDKQGNPIDPSKMARLNLRISGPAHDYGTLISEDARRAQGVPGQYFWTTLRALPANASGTWAVSLEGRTEITVLPGTTKQQTIRDTGINSTVFVSVDGSAMQPRRQIVTTQKCNACHFQMAFHGDARNTVENCAVCHSSSLVAGSGANAQPVEFATMIHRIHRGHSLENPYVIGNANFNEIGYPGDLRRCDACHVNNSQNLPLRGDLRPVATPAGPVNQVPKMTSACVGCHDGIVTLAHALTNTNELGETCGTCHGPNSEFSVQRVHQP